MRPPSLRGRSFWNRQNPNGVCEGLSRGDCKIMGSKHDDAQASRGRAGHHGPRGRRARGGPGGRARLARGGGASRTAGPGTAPAGPPAVGGCGPGGRAGPFAPAAARPLSLPRRLWRLCLDAASGGGPAGLEADAGPGRPGAPGAPGGGPRGGDGGVSRGARLPQQDRADLRAHAGRGPAPGLPPSRRRARRGGHRRLPAGRSRHERGGLGRPGALPRRPRCGRSGAAGGGRRPRAAAPARAALAKRGRHARRLPRGARSVPLRRRPSRSA